MPRNTPYSDANAARLAELARRDGDRLSPIFSEARHVRIMAAVDSASVAPLQIAPLAWRSPRRSWQAPMALAAGIAIVAIAGIALLWRGPTDAGNPQIVDKHATPAPAPARTMPTVTPLSPALAFDQVAQQVNGRVQGVVQTAMAEQQWAGLDQDVRAATRYLVDQVPLRAAWQSDGTQEQR